MHIKARHIAKIVVNLVGLVWQKKIYPKQIFALNIGAQAERFEYNKVDKQTKKIEFLLILSPYKQKRIMGKGLKQTQINSNFN